MLTFLKELWALLKLRLYGQRTGFLTTEGPIIHVSRPRGELITYENGVFTRSVTFPKGIEAGELRKEIELKKDEWVKLDMEDKACIRELGKR
jgi:hypothetical protein